MLALLLCTLAHADDATYEKGVKIARGGEYALIGGASALALGLPLTGAGIVASVNCQGGCGAVGLLGAGLALDAGGAVAVLAGPPIMAAGGLKAARGLEESGVTVPTWAGKAAWGMWGGSFAASMLSGALSDVGDGRLGTVSGLLATPLFVGSIVCGSVQLHQVLQADPGDARLPELSQVRPFVAPAPLVTPEGSGLAVVGVF